MYKTWANSHLEALAAAYSHEGTTPHFLLTIAPNHNIK